MRMAFNIGQVLSWSREIGMKQGMNSPRIRYQWERDPPPWFQSIFRCFFLPVVMMVLADGIDYHETLHADFSDCSTALLEGSQLELRSTGVILEVPEGFWANCADRAEGIIMCNSNDSNITSWESASNHILANNSALAVAVRQLCLTAIEEGKEMLTLPIVDPVLGTFYPTGKPQMLGRQAVFNIYSTSVGGGRLSVAGHHLVNMDSQFSNLSSTGLSDLIGLIDWKALISPASPLLAAVGIKVAAEAVNSVLVAVVGRPDTGVRDAKQHEGVLRSVLSSMQLATPALLVDGVANLTWQELLTQSKWIRRDELEKGSWADSMDFTSDGDFSLQQHLHYPNGSRILSGLDAITSQTGNWSVSGSCVQFQLGPDNLTYNFLLQWDETSNELWLDDEPFKMTSSGL